MFSFAKKPLSEGLLETTGQVSQDERLGIPLGAAHESDERKKIKSELNWMKAIYFFTNLGSTCWGRFAQVYYLQKGLGPAQVGLIEASMPLVQFLTQPIWGVVADVTGDRKRVYLVTKVLNTVALLLYAAPWLPSGFPWLLGVAMLMSCFVANGIIDAHVLHLCTSLDRNLYGTVRLWGAASWGIGAFAMGIINDLYGFDYNFILYGSFALISIVLLHWKVPDKKPTVQLSGASGSTSSLSGVVDSGEVSKWSTTWELMHLLLRWKVSLFLMEVVIAGMGVGAVERLLFLYVIDNLEGTATLCGTVVLVTVLFEIPIFQHAELIHRKLGHSGCLLVAYFCYFIRVWGYTILTPATLYWLLALEALHGFTFALLWTAVVDYSHRLVPAHWGASMQSILNVFYYNLGNGLGALVGGFVMEHYGARLMYRCAGMCICLLFLVRTVGTVLAKSRCTGDNNVYSRISPLIA